MIELKVLKKQTTVCPVCQAKNGHGEYDFYGKHILLGISCNSCGSKYYHTTSIGHSIDFPVAFSQDMEHRSFSEASRVWHAAPLLKAIASSTSISANISRKIYDQQSKVVVLNCLDDCYGHVLWRLFNAQRHLEDREGLGLIIIIPKSFEWLVPEGVAEVWSIDIALSKLNNRIDGFDSWVKTALSAYDQVFFSKAYVQLDHHKIAIEKFVKQRPFDLNSFDQTPYHLTYVLREDRFWLGSKGWYLMYKLAIRLRALDATKFLFIKRQAYLINKLAHRLSKRKDIHQCAVGIGKSGRLTTTIQDLRTEQMTVEIEHQWCELYAKSNLVLGVHGSNMMIPTALSAGFIELVPEDKVGHYTEATLLAHDNRLLSFLGRYLPDFSGPAYLEKQVAAILDGFELLNKNTNRGK